MDSGNGETLGEYVKRIRLEKNLSVKAVSKKSGINTKGKYNISPAYVNKVENGNPNLSAPKLDALAKGLEVSRAEIYAVAYNIEFDVKTIPFERFSKIAERYSNLPNEAKDNLEPFLSAFEATVEQAAKNQFSGPITKENIPIMSVNKIKEKRGNKSINGEGKKK